MGWKGEGGSLNEDRGRPRYVCDKGEDVILKVHLDTTLVGFDDLWESH